MDLIACLSVYPGVCKKKSLKYDVKPIPRPCEVTMNYMAIATVRDSPKTHVCASHVLASYWLDSNTLKFAYVIFSHNLPPVLYLASINPDHLFLRYGAPWNPNTKETIFQQPYPLLKVPASSTRPARLEPSASMWSQDLPYCSSTQPSSAHYTPADY